MSATVSMGPLPGFGGLLRKELLDWRRGKRLWTVLVVTAAFMTLSSLNAWLQANVLPSDGGPGVPNPIVDPVINLAAAVTSQVFVVVAVFAVMNVMTTERESGTLAWTASKPVSRGAIWAAKLVSSLAVLALAAGIVPFAATISLVGFLYGEVPVAAAAMMAVGIVLSITFYVIVALVAGTIVSSPGAVAGIAIGMILVQQIAAVIVPAAFMPGSILGWAIGMGIGQPVGAITPVVWAISIAALVAVALRQMERSDL